MELGGWWGKEGRGGARGGRHVQRLCLCLPLHALPTGAAPLRCPGATICKPRDPSCKECPVSGACHALRGWREHLAAGGDEDIEGPPRVTAYPSKVQKADKKAGGWRRLRLLACACAGIGACSACSACSSGRAVLRGLCVGPCSPALQQATSLLPHLSSRPICPLAKSWSCSGWCETGCCSSSSRAGELSRPPARPRPRHRCRRWPPACCGSCRQAQRRRRLQRWRQRRCRRARQTCSSSSSRTRGRRQRVGGRAATRVQPPAAAPPQCSPLAPCLAAPPGPALCAWRPEQQQPPLGSLALQVFL
jgi:hypothetical protein